MHGSEMEAAASAKHAISILPLSPADPTTNHSTTTQEAKELR